MLQCRLWPCIALDSRPEVLSTLISRIDVTPRAMLVHTSLKEWMQTQSPGRNPSALSPAMSCLVIFRADLGVTYLEASLASIRTCRLLSDVHAGCWSWTKLQACLDPLPHIERQRKANLYQVGHIPHPLLLHAKSCRTRYCRRRGTAWRMYKKSVQRESVSRVGFNEGQERKQ